MALYNGFPGKADSSAQIRADLAGAGRRLPSLNPAGGPDYQTQSAARELYLFINNDGDLYRQQFEPIQKNLQRKVDKGTYNHALAAKLFMYLVESGAKKYVREFAGPGSSWHQMFSMADRRAVAESLRDDFEVEIEAGNRYNNPMSWEESTTPLGIPPGSRQVDTNKKNLKTHWIDPEGNHWIAPFGGPPRRYISSAAARIDLRRNPAAGAMIPSLNPGWDWSVSAGGTSAYDPDKYGYSIRTDRGEYHIWPPQRRGGGYILKFAGNRYFRAPGAHTGLWHDLGSYHRSPQAAKSAAKAHYATLVPWEQANPLARSGGVHEAVDFTASEAARISGGVITGKARAILPMPSYGAAYVVSSDGTYLSAGRPGVAALLRVARQFAAQKRTRNPMFAAVDPQFEANHILAGTYTGQTYLLDTTGGTARFANPQRRNPIEIGEQVEIPKMNTFAKVVAVIRKPSFPFGQKVYKIEVQTESGQKMLLSPSAIRPI